MMAAAATTIAYIFAARQAADAMSRAAARYRAAGILPKVESLPRLLRPEMPPTFGAMS